MRFLLAAAGEMFRVSTLDLVNSGAGTLGAGVVNVGGTSGTLTATTVTVNSTLTSFTGLTKNGDGTLKPLARTE